jgi:hypothetical protein
MSELAIERSLSVQSRVGKGWIVSPAFDLFLLMLGPVVAAPIMFGYFMGNRLLAIGGSLTLAAAHYLSSLAFYFWQENKEYHRERWIAFYLGPLILAAIYSILIVLRVPYVLQFTLFFWNAVHVARQNCGILSVYRHRGGVTDVSQKTAANRAIISTAIFLSLWNIETHMEVTALFDMVARNIAPFIRIGAGVVAVISIADLVRVLWKRSRIAKTIQVPEAMFLLASLVYFYPFLIIRRSEMAFLATLLPHYVQYMALVWLVHRRKFGAADQGGVSLPLKKLSGNLIYLLPTLAIVGFSFYILNNLLAEAGKQAVFQTLFILIAFEHFYLDGLIWSFKRKHVRDTIGPALTGAPAR